MNTDRKTPSRTNINQQTGREILETIESISFGEVVVTIHDRRVVQIEKKEKKRF
jgi:hypothetical protein